MDTKEFLSHIFLFESLSDTHMELVTSIAEERHIQRGSLLFSEGMPAHAFYVIVRGSAKIFKLSPDGGEHIVHIHQEGELIAEAIIFEFDEYPAYCEAIDDLDLIRFPKTAFLDILKESHQLTLNIMRAYSRRLRQLINKIEELSLHDVKSRLAAYLVNNSEKIDGSLVCRLTVTKKDLASVLGTIPETLSRTLLFFRREDLIRVSKDEIVILNLKKLKTIGAH